MVNPTKLMFPHGSKDFFDLNPGLRDPFQQQNVKIPLGSKIKRKAKGNGIIEVRINSCRKRFLDKDNLVGGAKGLVDCLQIAGIIPNDSPEFVRLTYNQYKIKKTKQRTIIEIIYP